MGRVDDVMRQEREALERAQTPEGTPVEKPNRAEVLSIRLTPEEAEQLRSRAAKLELPMSTLVRSWIARELKGQQQSPLSSALEDLRFGDLIGKQAGSTRAFLEGLEAHQRAVRQALDELAAAVRAQEEASQ